MNQKENYFTLSVDKTAELLKTDAKQGLSVLEADRRLKEYGANTLENKKQKSLFLILVQQFNNPIVWILLAATILAFFTGEHIEGIAVVIVINASIGLFMEMLILLTHSVFCRCVQRTDNDNILS
jgi:Ca2+-transporting ATPase